MNNKQKTHAKIFTLIVSGMLLVYASHAFAAKQAIFPDSKALQPMPANVKPNTSGNVNNTTSGIFTAPSAKEADAKTDIEIGTATDKEDASSKKIIYTYFAIFLSAALVAIFVIMHKNKKKSI